MHLGGPNRQFGTHEKLSCGGKYILDFLITLQNQCKFDVFSMYSQTSMAQTSLGPYKIYMHNRDNISTSHKIRYTVCNHQNRLIEIIFMGSHNILFEDEIRQPTKTFSVMV